MKTSVKAPAKINLTLDVTGKRTDGYHDVKMIMTTVDLADRIHLSLQDRQDIEVRVNNGQLPTDENNLAFQSAALLKSKFHIQGGVVIDIDKYIPVSAGLAGGSTDAAAVLRGLNDLWQLGLTLEQLAEIGLQIGSDVPFCVYGGTALAEGRGEKLTFLPSPPTCWVVLAKPPAGVATKDIYKRLRLNDIEHPDTAGMIRAIENSDYREVCRLLQNVMETATFELNADVKKIKDRMIESGADGTVMSGSGPTVFSLCRNDKKALRLYNALKGFVDQVYLVRMLG
ncbi:4-(cytidine 5'-diphospho)-2-C-methyl-D-erythritol kinase [Salisediminibacterium halotolerans]|uniref:4-diphosphocytidyl-2-C-methyl-D-erythritol kinase n=1 Tax=Salisediminibacterium halotolerans TaxID=517425 RepID=A0A1H9VRI3_9BACI|nr:MULTISPECIES: 4-(cytidine 5'-diphospho)-2-C-methyl-D-erythritol kinase [Salisediminibacterium]RLJ80957.1 4-diphosphocytidyl-2-C-methyl-D-erythritol kinase [Actinophytocola xinjiangensis]RPE83638.1 4-diphosphocytidyl-2-C-methyl-D-erythritol kinase [Salisediminibacterium halotolerans]TWG37882.1 4-diphosphocytidyl-2-C-methyl-D-erythritol kinase [Salisediminibacterium halotolerans]SES24275.1 4-diphosphocytidyl-2-C-methyl-D-erythritol kinase [Salisediminibacterium haloalkalitolerans]GEL07014.1 4